MSCKLTFEENRALDVSALQSTGTTAHNAQRDALRTPAVLFAACKYCSQVYVFLLLYHIEHNHIQKQLGIRRIWQVAQRVPCDATYRPKR
jgi:hypothetical protein